MKLKKRIAVLLALIVAISSLALAFNAFGLTNNKIDLDQIYIDTTSGKEDKIWYTYTPGTSGNFAFISYSTAKSEAYLFTRTTNPDGSRVFNQIKYAPASDPNNREHFYEFYDSDTQKTYTHSSSAFYMECYLEAGTTYYFAAGCSVDSTTSITIRARLTQIDEDDNPIESISATTTAYLSAFGDGDWKFDSNGDKYFEYSISKVIQNTTITVKLKTGKTDTVRGSDGIYCGQQISFNHSQNENHWYVQGSDEYVSNLLTVSVGSTKCELEVPIISSAMYQVKGKVVDYVTGEPIKDAEIIVGGTVKDTTNDNGNFSFVYNSGQFNVTIKTSNSIDKNFVLVIDANDSTKNNYISNPFRIVDCDYVKDGIINAKDFAYAKKKGLSNINSTVINFKQY